MTNRVEKFLNQAESNLAEILLRLGKVEASAAGQFTSILGSIQPKVPDSLPFVTKALSITQTTIKQLDSQVQSLAFSTAASLKAPPISGYDTLTANQVVQSIKGLSAEDIHAVRHYEANHKNRTTVLKALDRLENASS